jgi:thiol-disulfide isomerase/thioredoxin
MKLLETQDHFETLWQADPKLAPVDGARKSDHMFLVYFTANWCGYCKRIDLNMVDKVATAKGLTLWKCEHTINDFTSGFCGVRGFPTFMAFKPRKVIDQLQTSSTEEICAWIQSL